MAQSTYIRTTPCTKGSLKPMPHTCVQCVRESHHGQHSKWTTPPHRSPTNYQPLQRKLFIFATPKFAVKPDTNLDSESVLAPQTQATFLDDTVASRSTTSVPNTKAALPSLLAQNPPGVIMACRRVKERPYILQIRKLSCYSVSTSMFQHYVAGAALLAHAPPVSLRSL